MEEKKLILTCGDINGIGPEIILKSLKSFLDKTNKKFIVIIPAKAFDFYYQNLKCSFDYSIVSNNRKAIENNAKVCLLNLGSASLKIGQPTKKSGELSYEAIVRSIELYKTGRVEAIITAPISKYSFYLANINYPGHTELFAEQTGAKNYAMTFISRKLKCSLVTIHKPLKEISKNLSVEKIKNHLNLIGSVLINDFAIDNPKIAVLGLNPHAGEDGKIGDEEKEIIYPAILNSDYNKNISGPFSADGFFGNKAYLSFDFVVGMYHDQVLIPFKVLNFMSGVNYTAGLPLIRTSPDHGTAFDIAGKFIANEKSFLEAIKIALKISRNRAK